LKNSRIQEVRPKSSLIVAYVDTVTRVRNFASQ
jgi:hypothetical protein